MAEFPALPLWTDAYLADTGHLDDAEHGRYFLILMHLWRMPEQRFPNDIAWLSRKFRRSAQAFEKEVLPLMHEFCQCDGNWWTQKRLKTEWDYVKASSEKQSHRAKARWNKEKDESRGNARTHRSGNAPTPTPTPTPIIRESTTLIVPAPSADDVSVALDAYNAVAKQCGLPVATKLSPARRTKLRVRLNEHGMDAWRACLVKLANNHWMHGENDRGWRADFDFLLQPSKFIKLLEGGYDRTNGVAREPTVPKRLRPSQPPLIERSRETGQ